MDGVLIAPDDLESREETIALLSDPEAMAEIAEARAAVTAGDVTDAADVRMRARS